MPANHRRCPRTVGSPGGVQHGAGLVVPPRTGPPPGSGPPWPGTQHFFLDLDSAVPPTPLGCLLAAYSPRTPSMVCWHACCLDSLFNRAGDFRMLRLTITRLCSTAATSATNSLSCNAALARFVSWATTTSSASTADVTPLAAVCKEELAPRTVILDVTTTTSSSSSSPPSTSASSGRTAMSTRYASCAVLSFTCCTTAGASSRFNHSDASTSFSVSARTSLS